MKLLMNSKQLEYFLVLAGDLHFGKASIKLFISQPALSKQIRDLENELGVSLFDRNNRNVKLTPAGIFLKGEAELMVERIADIKRKLQLIASGAAGELNIGFVGSAMQSLIPDALQQLHSRFPEIHTSLHELTNQHQMEAIQQDKLDVGFVRSEHFPATLDSKIVLEENFVLVVPDGHYLQNGDFPDPSVLQNEKFILFGTSYSQDYYQLVMSIFRQWGFEPQVSHRSVHAATIFHLVQHQLGIAVVPESLTRGFDLNIRFLRLDQVQQKTRLSMIWKRQREDALVKNFIDLFGENR
ncbi:MAG: LysR family transcriptional regulator [Saprospiraceae bacterium]|nr:LysR family transcriptional regulator [Saprospiraceae bacterium]